MPTPAFAPVGTQGTVKAALPEAVAERGAALLMANAYHLALRPGAETIQALGGLHRFAAWDGALMTDSGGYQVFSLAHRRRLDPDGVTFASHLDGSAQRFTPERVMAIQEALGADLIMPLDVCSPYPSGPEAAERDLELTLRWAARAQSARRRPDQWLYGIVQGATGGTTILLHDGVYDLDGGDAASRLVFATPGVTMRSLSGDRDAVVLDGGYQTDELISIVASNVTIADLTVREAYNHPVHVSGVGAPISGTLLRNLRVVDPGQQAIKINAVGQAWADFGTIECSAIELTDAGRSHVRDSCYTGGVDAHSARGWIVRRNRISGFWCAAGLSEHGVHFWSASRDTVVEENVIVDCARGIGFGLGQSGADRQYPDDPYPGVGYLGHVDGVVRNNFVAASDPDLFASLSGFDAGIAIEQARTVLVAHNTVVSTAPPFSSIEWRWANTIALVTPGLSLRSRVLRVRYEDLVERPDEALGRIGAFLGADLSEVRRKVRGGESFPVGHNTGGNRMRQGGAVKLRVDREWERRLPAVERAAFWLLAWPWALLFGYRPGARRPDA